MSWFAELAHPQRHLVEVASEIARSQKLDVFLVGGPVRDLALRRMFSDLDLVLEERADAFAYDLARTLHASMHVYPQFLTQKIVAEGLPMIDIASTRAEHYPRPGALPHVTPSTLSTDLERRDFSVNAMALEIVTQTWIDPFDGLGDLERKSIRILHDASFVDDPTRMFRAVRLAIRLGFDLEQRSSELAREAIEGGAVRTISRERVWREILLTLREPHPGASLAAFLDAGLLSSFLDLVAGARTAADLVAIDSVPRNEELDLEVIVIGTLIRWSRRMDVAVQGAGLSNRRMRTALEIASNFEPLTELLTNAGSNRDRFEILARASMELRVLVATQLADLAALVRSMNRAEAEPLGIRGDELGVPPGPHIGLALERTRQALFLGEISREEATSFARALALQYLETRP